MKLVLLGMDPVHVEFTRIAVDYSARCGVRTHDSMMRPELKSGALTARPTWLRDHIVFIADHVSDEPFDNHRYKCEIFLLKNNICVWSSIDRRFFKCVNQSSEAISVSRLILISSISLFLFDLVFRTTVTLRD